MCSISTLNEKLAKQHPIYIYSVYIHTHEHEHKHNTRKNRPQMDVDFNRQNCGKLPKIHRNSQTNQSAKNEFQFYK